MAKVSSTSVGLKGVGNLGNQRAKSTPKVRARPNTTSKTPASQKARKGATGRGAY